MAEDEQDVTGVEPTQPSAGEHEPGQDAGTPAPAGATAGARTQHLIHVRPHDDEGLVQATAPVLARLDPSIAGAQVLVITTDADGALELAARAGAIVPVTGVRRAARLIRAQHPAAISGSASDLLTLVRESALKLDEVRAIVIGWADDIESAGQLGALDALLGEVPKEATRTLLTGTMTSELEALAERHLWKARRLGDELETSAIPMRIQYLVVTPSARPSALRRVLDELDPPSAVIVARFERSYDEVRATLRALGHGDDDALVRVSRGEVEPNAALVVLYDAPLGDQELATVSAATPAQVVTFARPRQLETLRRLTGGALAPLPAPAALAKARARAERMRAELREALADGLAAREAIVLDPLLAEFDGVELAAAALVLLERERAKARAMPAAPVVAPAAPGAAVAAADGWTYVFLGIGEKDGARPGDIVGAVSGESGITSDKIGRIELRDSHTVVQIAPEVAEKVVRAMSGATVKGRQLVARIDQRRPAADAASRERGRPARGGERPTRGGPPRGGDRPSRGGPPRGGDRPPTRGRRDEGGERSFRPRGAGGDRPFRPRDGGGDRPFRPRDGGGDRPFRSRDAGGDRPSHGARRDEGSPSSRTPRAMQEREEWSGRGERMTHARRAPRGDKPAPGGDDRA